MVVCWLGVQRSTSSAAPPARSSSELALPIDINYQARNARQHCLCLSAQLLTPKALPTVSERWFSTVRAQLSPKPFWVLPQLACDGQLTSCPVHHLPLALDLRCPVHWLCQAMSHMLLDLQETMLHHLCCRLPVVPAFGNDMTVFMN